MTVHNRLRELLAAGETARGLSLVLGDPQIAEEFAHSGVDYVYVDQQHGHVDHTRLLATLRALAATDVTPLVRVPTLDDAAIATALDAGAHGVIVPMVETVEQAREAVQASRYFPWGRRSWGPVRATHGLGTDPATVNAEVMCLVMIETATGVENASGILAVDGIDGAYLGPADLSVSLGFSPRAIEQTVDAAPLEAVERVRAACALHGKVAAITGDLVTRSAAGFSMVTLASDITLVRSGLAALPEQPSTTAHHTKEFAR